MPEWLKSILPSGKFMLRLAVMSLPVGYILKKHLDWKPKPDSKKRMLIHHVVFWLSCIPALKFLHKTPGKLAAGRQLIHLEQGTNALDAVKWPAASVATLLAGFEGGDRLAKLLVPKQPKPPINTPSPMQPVIPSSFIGPQMPYASTSFPMRPMPPYTLNRPTTFALFR